jgi:fucose 4-O-acetylase-like acetyltransferase
MAWTGLGTWVFDEPKVHEPLLTLLSAIELIGAMFGMALFFLIAGLFTPRSLARKGLRRFLVDRTVRLGVPMAFFMLVLSPVVEYADPENLGWNRGFWPFVPFIWRRFIPGPTWFLGVLLVFSAVYAVVRTALPRPAVAPRPLRARTLVVIAVAVAVASYLVRLFVPLGEEVWHMGLAQAPAWGAGFVIGALAGERGWFEQMTASMSRALFRTAWIAVAATVVTVAAVGTGDDELDALGGAGTWQSLIAAGIEAALMVAMSLWLVDVFRRRFDHQGGFMRELSRSAFAAFIVHQVVLVGLVLATHRLPWPPEVEFLAVCAIGVAASFAVGSALVRIPGVRRIV